MRRKERKEMSQRDPNLSGTFPISSFQAKPRHKGKTGVFCMYSEKNGGRSHQPFSECSWGGWQQMPLHSSQGSKCEGPLPLSQVPPMGPGTGCPRRPGHLPESSAQFQGSQPGEKCFTSRQSGGRQDTTGEAASHPFTHVPKQQGLPNCLPCPSLF